MRFSKEVREVLEEAGWYEGRKIDVSEQLRYYERYGFEIFDALPKFLEEFDGIKFLEKRTLDKVRAAKERGEYYDMPARSYFSVASVLYINETDTPEKLKLEKEVMERHVKEYSSEKFVPVGSVCGHMTMFLTETGKIVTDLTVEGMSVEESIKNIIMEEGSCLWSEFCQSFKKLSLEEIIRNGKRITTEPEILEYFSENIEKDIKEENIQYCLDENGNLKYYYYFVPRRERWLPDRAEKVVYYDSGRIKSRTHKGSDKECVGITEWYESGMIKSCIFREKEKSWIKEFDENGFYIRKSTDYK